MQKLLLTTAALASTLVATAAGAQSYDYGRRDYDRNDNNRYEQRRDNDRYDRGYQSQQRWQRGQRLPQTYRSSRYVFNDYQRYGYRAPPRGYAYYRTDTGDIVLAAIATGVIASIIGNLFDNNSSSYAQPYYAPQQPYYAPAQPYTGYPQTYTTPPPYSYQQPYYGR